MTLAAAGDPVSVAYIGSRTLLKLSAEGLIVPADISEEAAANYQPGVLKTVSSGGKYWGYPHAFSTKALYINCDLVVAAGMECKAPATWALAPGGVSRASRAARRSTRPQSSADARLLRCASRRPTPASGTAASRITA